MRDGPYIARMRQGRMQMMLDTKPLVWKDMADCPSEEAFERFIKHKVMQNQRRIVWVREIDDARD